MTNLPTLAELHYDVQAAFKNDQLTCLLNQPPHQDWLKKHPMTKGDYLPIDKIEFMLSRIWQKWYVQVLSYQVIFQSVAVHVRLHYYNPYGEVGEWQYQDGLGACPVQTDAGKSPADLAAIKNAAVQMALPAAESYAIKDACEKMGTLFGKDLNRKDTVMFAGAFNDGPPAPNGNGHTNGFTRRYEEAHTYNTAPPVQAAPVTVSIPPAQASTPSFTFNPTEL